MTNTSDQINEVTITFYGRDLFDLPVSWAAPPLTLSARQSLRVDLSSYAATPGFPLVEGFASAGIHYTGEPGSLIADGFTVDPSLSLSMHCPLRDLAFAAGYKVAVSVDLSEGKDTLLLAKNTFDQEVKYFYEIHCEASKEKKVYASARSRQ